MMTQEKQQRFEAAAQVLFARKEPVKFELDMILTVGLIGQLQLAFRHPANTGPTSEMLKKFVIELIEKLDPGKGDIYEFLMHGFNPNYDTIFYRNCQEQVSIIEGFCEKCLERICSHCGCTDSEPCEDGCHWATPQICSTCVENLEHDFI